MPDRAAVAIVTSARYFPCRQRGMAPGVTFGTSERSGQVDGHTGLVDLPFTTEGSAP